MDTNAPVRVSRVVAVESLNVTTPVTANSSSSHSAAVCAASTVA